MPPSETFFRVSAVFSSIHFVLLCALCSTVCFPVSVFLDLFVFSYLPGEPLSFQILVSKVMKVFDGAIFCALGVNWLTIGPMFISVLNLLTFSTSLLLSDY